MDFEHYTVKHLWAKLREEELFIGTYMSHCLLHISIIAEYSEFSIGIKSKFSNENIDSQNIWLSMLKQYLFINHRNYREDQNKLGWEIFSSVQYNSTYKDR